MQSSWGGTPLDDGIWIGGGLDRVLRLPMWNWNGNLDCDHVGVLHYRDTGDTAGVNRSCICL